MTWLFVCPRHICIKFKIYVWPCRQVRQVYEKRKIAETDKNTGQSDLRFHVPVPGTYVCIYVDICVPMIKPMGCTLMTMAPTMTTHDGQFMIKYALVCIYAKWANKITLTWLNLHKLYFSTKLFSVHLKVQIKVSIPLASQVEEPPSWLFGDVWSKPLVYASIPEKTYVGHELKTAPSTVHLQVGNRLFQKLSWIVLRAIGMKYQSLRLFWLFQRICTATHWMDNTNIFSINNDEF